MKSKPVSNDVGFADSEILSYRKDDDALVVTVKLWNERRVSLVFDDANGVTDLGGGDLSDVVEVEGMNPLLEAVLRQVYVNEPPTHSYRGFQFLSLDGDAVLQVVATAVRIVPADNA